MQDNYSTLAIYGIPDTMDHPYPEYVHDHNITLYQGGGIRRHLALERITRRKYDSTLPARLYGLLKEEGLLGMKRLRLVFVDNPVGRAFINSQGNIRFEGPMNDSLALGPEKGRGYMPGREVEAWVVNHELAHVFTNLPFYGPFRDNSLHVHFDGGASKGNFSAWHYEGGSLKLIESGWQMKYLSSLFNANALCFSIIGADKKDQNSFPGKFMGYASYGHYDPRIEKWLTANGFFQDIWSNKKVFFKKLQEDWGIHMRGFDQKHPFLRNVAATVQHIFERDLLDKMAELKERTRTDHLYYTGGSALNIKANTALLNSGMFEHVYIPPCTNDSGLSIGAAACLGWFMQEEPRVHGPYLNNWGLKDTGVHCSGDELEVTARLLSEGEVVAVCNGPGESGPRALGNRSILARADDPELAHYISTRMKGREWYRPLAPVVLARNLPHITGQTYSRGIARFMLRDYRIPSAMSQPVQGAVHVDGTARIQVLEDRKDNPYLYDLMDRLEEKYQITALINTSFNAPGKPIVHTPGDALREARAMGIRFLVLNGRLKHP